MLIAVKSDINDLNLFWMSILSHSTLNLSWMLIVAQNNYISFYTPIYGNYTTMKNALLQALKQRQDQWIYDRIELFRNIHFFYLLYNVLPNNLLAIFLITVRQEKCKRFARKSSNKFVTQGMIHGRKCYQWNGWSMEEWEEHQAGKGDKTKMVPPRKPSQAALNAVVTTGKGGGWGFFSTLKILSPQ